MAPNQNDDIAIVNTVKEDLENVLLLFAQAMQLQGKNGYKVWNNIDKTALEKDIDNKLQYKIIKGNNILCIFSIQYNDPFIWRDKDNNNAIYLHRIVTNTTIKGQRNLKKFYIGLNRLQGKKIYNLFGWIHGQTTKK